MKFRKGDMVAQKAEAVRCGRVLRVFSRGPRKLSDGDWSLGTPMTELPSAEVMIVLDVWLAPPAQQNFQCPALYVLTSSGAMGWVWFERLKRIR